MVSFPYHSHVRIPKDMGMVWVPSMGPAYHKGVPCPWGSRVNPTEYSLSVTFPSNLFLLVGPVVCSGVDHSMSLGVMD